MAFKLVVRCFVALVLLSLTEFRLAGQIQTMPGGQQPPVAPRTNTTTTRSIEGVVSSRSGTPVAGAVVLLKDTKTLQVRSYITQKDGSYHFFGLSMDVNYELRAQADGMTSKTRTLSVFNSRTRVKLDLKLSKKAKA